MGKMEVITTADANEHNDQLSTLTGKFFRITEWRFYSEVGVRGYAKRMKLESVGYILKKGKRKGYALARILLDTDVNDFDFRQYLMGLKRKGSLVN